MSFSIRNSTLNDIKIIMELIEYGKQKMRESGNMNQWTNGDPNESIIKNDIENNNSYIIELDNEPIGTFAFVLGPDPTYLKIYEGKWINEDNNYYVIHRISSKPKGKGIMKEILKFCFSKTKNIRIDTHRDNKIMRHILEKEGFKYCGIIYLEDGAERFAYQKILN